MIVDFLVDYAWVVWLALILVFVIIEVVTLDFTFLMIAVGSLGGLVSGLLGVPWWGQIIVTGILSILLLFAVRPPLLKRLRSGGDPTPSNVDALLGLAGVVTTDFNGSTNHVRLANGENWTARADDDGDLVEGSRIVVTAIDGAIAVVAPAEESAP